MASTREEIDEFWGWFSDHSEELRPNRVTPQLIAELEHRLFAIRKLDWEIGPAKDERARLVISPAGNRDQLPVVREIIARAPLLPRWEFHAGKVRRDWNLRFTIDVGDRSVEIDAKRWEFVLYEFKDGTFDLVLKPDEPQDLSPVHLDLAAVIIVDGELGEETRLSKILALDVVSAWNSEQSGSARSLEPGLLAKLVGSA